MKLKQRLFRYLSPWARHYPVFIALAVAQLLISLALLLFWPDIDTSLWLLSFTLFGFWLANYALLRMVAAYQPDRRGFIGWCINGWENLLFISWLALSLYVLFMVVKLSLALQ